MAAVTICSDFGAQKNKVSHCFHFQLFVNKIFYCKIFTLQYCADFCHTSTWISHRYTYVPSLLNLSAIPHPIPPSRLSQSTRLSSLCHSKSPLSILYMVIFMFPCCSLNLSHLLHPTLCPQVCSLCLNLHCCPENRFISAMFLDSIHMH